MKHYGVNHDIVLSITTAPPDAFAVLAHWGYDQQRQWGEPAEDLVTISFEPIPCFALLDTCVARRGEECEPIGYPKVVPCVPDGRSVYAALSERGQGPNLICLGLWYAREGDRDRREAAWRKLAVEEWGPGGFEYDYINNDDSKAAAEARFLKSCIEAAIEAGLLKPEPGRAR